MIIQEIDLFKGIGRKTADAIASISIEESFKPDTVLFQKGENAGNLYVLLEGKVDLMIKNGGSIYYMLSEPGEVFGWSSLVESGEYTASAVSVTDLKVFRIESEKLEKILSLHPKDGIIILKRLSGIILKRLSNAYKELLDARKQQATPVYG
jgi:CRP-like cAMP-binding protein